MFRMILSMSLLVLLAACNPTSAPLSNESNETRGRQDNHNDVDTHDNHEQDDGQNPESTEHEHEENERREYGVHQHGIAEMTVAWSANDVAVDLQTPAFNVLAYEHMPESEEDRLLLNEVITTFETGSLLQFSESAQCSLISAVVDTGFLENENEDEEEAHSDIDVTYNFQCQQPDHLTQLDLTLLFKSFPNFEKLDVQWVSDSQQSAAELTSSKTILYFE